MSDKNDNIIRIIERLRRDESRAFDEIFHMYSGKIYRFAYSFLKNKKDAEDVMQDVFLVVWKNRKKIDKKFLFRSFLFTISYNLIIDKFRERVKENRYIEFLNENAITLNYETEKETEYSDLNELYTKTIELLPERRRIIYKLHRMEGFTYQEISDKLQISPKTVENQMTSALKFLRKKLRHEMLTE